MIEISFIIAFIVLFLNFCTHKGEIFAIVSKTLNKQPEWIKKPLYDCQICMSVWWGFSIQAVGITSGVWHIKNFVECIIINATAAGINVALVMFKSESKK